MPKDLGISLTRRWRCSEKLSRSFQKKIGQSISLSPVPRRGTRVTDGGTSGTLTRAVLILPTRANPSNLSAPFFAPNKRTYQHLPIPSNPDGNAGAIALGKRRWDPRLAVTATGRAAPPREKNKTWGALISCPPCSQRRRRAGTRRDQVG